MNLGDDGTDLADAKAPLTVVEKRVAAQVFAVSAAMVGVCLTLMGLVGIISSLSQIATLTEELLAADALVFLVACLSSYFSLRTRSTARAHSFERLADLMFIIAMTSIVGIGGIVALHLT